MNAFSVRLSARLGVAALAVAAAAGCARLDDWSRSAVDVVTPYRVEVVQGNFVSREQVQALRAGMGRAQVREILGTPLLTSVFHDARWDYVFTIRRAGVAEQTRRLSVFFDGDAFVRTEGDELPSEEEFVATITRPARTGAAPVLEATPEQLARAQASAQPSAPASSQPSTAAPRASYPPLE